MVNHAKMLCLFAVLGLLAVSVLLIEEKGEARDTAARTGFLVTDPRCEDMVTPMGVDSLQPRLSWRVASEVRGQKQTAYQVLVASSKETLAKNEGDLWDSGRIASPRTLQVPYAGKTLETSQRVHWKVRSWDVDGQPSPWGQDATWTMGVLKPEDWKGVWVVSPGATESLLLRHEFTVKPGLRRAIAHVSGLGQYEMSLNGVKAGDDFLSPGWTAYDRTVLYDTRDVTQMLRAGTNAVGLLLGNGMYNVVRRDRFVKFTGTYGPLRAILHLRLEYTDGSVVFVGTDTNWRCHAGPITFNNIFGGEDYDARLNPQGWDRPGFDASAWQHVVTMVRPNGTLRGQSVAAPPLRVIETRKLVTVRTFPDGTAVYDFGQNASFIPRLQVKGPVGSTVRLTPAEIVNEDGTINTGTMGGSDRGGRFWQYTKGTNVEETWSPRFCYVGSRYLKAERLPANENGPRPEITSLESRIVHSTAAPLGSFSASNPRLNRIRDLVRWAQRSNMVSVLTDCPHREKLGWLEQYHLNGPSIRYEFDVAPIFTKGMNDMADAQLEDGLVPNIAPEYVKFKGTFRAAAEWGASFLLVPWQQYQFTGDPALFAKHYDAMKRYFAYLETRATDDVVSEGLGDWYDLGPNRPGVAQLTPPPVTATAFFYQDAAMLAQAAKLLGKDDDAKTYAARAEQIRKSYNRHFYHADTGSYATGAQCANALPLVMGIVEPGDRARVEAALVADVEAHGFAATAGDVGFRYLLLALAQANRSDVIYRIINQDDKPGYGYQLKKGATSLTEAWDANDKSSHNHFMLGQIIEWFYKDLVGIDTDPAAPGFEKIRIHPNPVGDLTWAEARYESVHGPIAVRWDREGGNRFRLDVTIPANTTATVYVPNRTGSPVLEGGAAANQQPGVTFLRNEGDRAVFTVASGHYRFESPGGQP
jgi:alpha-L-rhamnosidase